MPVYQFPIEGAKQLDKKLIALGPRIAKKVVRQAIRPAAKGIQRTAQANAPVDTGALKKSIKVRALKRSRTRIGITVATNSSDNLFKGKEFYGGLLEFGFRRGKRTNAIKQAQKKGKVLESDNRPLVPPRPFMKPAFDSNRDRAGQMIVDNLRSGIEREASR
jgi:HK97 gp10 family phage protein